MPLLHQDNGRGGGGSRENRRSLSEFIGFDTSQFSEPVVAPKNEQRPNEGGSGAAAERDWRWDDWEAPASPEAAQTPRSLVPAACFPPRHPTTFASYSESARPGDWPNSSGQQIPDLVASLKSLAMTPPSAMGGQQTQERQTYEANDKTVEPWSSEQASTSKEANTLPRAAFFCGVVRHGSEVSALRWCGALPPRGADPSGGYSPKVFLGGLPWDITEQALMHALRHFQPVRVEWPGREGAASSASGEGSLPRGYAYVTLEGERRVRALLASARRDGFDWYYRIASRNMRTKEVQVIPWAISDSHWVSGGSERPEPARLEPARTVFVGALHGMLSAYALALIMNDLFSGVVYAGIDTDKNKYPIGSGRVTFNNAHSYVRAISAAYVEICTDKFTKTVQVDPYLEDSMCSLCNLQQGPYFCREPVCFRYFCRSCWAWQHRSVAHKQLMRNSKHSHNGLAPTARSSAAGASPSGPSPSNSSGSGPSPSNSSGSGPSSSAPPRALRRAEQPCSNGGYNGPSDGTTPSPPSSGTSEIEATTPAGDAADPWP